MNVPNKELKAFKDMTPEERSAIVEAWLAGNAEVYCLLDGMWADKADAYIYKDSIYRTRPRQLIIPWEHIKSEYKWAAMDECGDVAIYDSKPVISEEDWLCGNNGHGKSLELRALNINTTDVDWRESLVQRPE